jgi:hypothetical protein
VFDLAVDVDRIPEERFNRAPLSVPCRPGTPAYRLESKTRKMYCHMPYIIGSCHPAREGTNAAMCPMALDPASLLVRALVLPRVMWLWILPPYSGGLWCYHVSRGSRSCLPTQEGSSAAMSPMTLDPASLLRRAPVLPHVPRHWTLPPWSGGLRRCHVSCGSVACRP